MSLISELLAISEAKTAHQLFENLGNLNSLGAGKLVDIFKQHFTKQTRPARLGGETSLVTAAVGKKLKIDNYWATGVGPSSKIEPIAKMVDFADVRKVFRTHEACTAMAFYAPAALNSSTAIMLIIDDDQQITKPSGTIGFAWDFTPVLKKLDNEKKEALAALVGEFTGSALKQKSSSSPDYEQSTEKSDMTSKHSTVGARQIGKYDKRQGLDTAKNEKYSDTRKKSYTDYEDWSDDAKAMSKNYSRGDVSIETDGDMKVAKWSNGRTGHNASAMELGRWDKKEKAGFIMVSHEPFNKDIEIEYGTLRSYAGVTVTVASVKTFIEAVVKIVGKLSGKSISRDLESRDKKQSRQQNRPVNTGVLSADELKVFKSELNLRLSKYKNTKLVSTDDAKTFAEQALSGSLKKLNFQGKTYNVSEHSTYEDRSLLSKILKGTPFKVTYDGDKETNAYRSISIMLKVDKATGKMTPISVELDGKSHVI